MLGSGADTGIVDGQLDLELVPTARLGRVLEAARGRRGLNLERVAAKTDHHFSPQALSAIEGGRLRLERDELEMLSEVYGVGTGELIPGRGELIIDLEGGTLAAGVHQRRLTEDAATDSDEVLVQYLSLVYAMREIEPGRPVPLRDLDLSVLSEALLESPGSLERRLKVLMANPDDQVGQRTRRLSRRLIVPAAGILVGATAVGVVVMIQSGGETPPPATVEIGEAVVQERGGEVETRTSMEAGTSVEPAAGVMGEVELIPPMVVKRGQDGQIVEVTPSEAQLIPPLVIESPEADTSVDGFD